ncbi:S-adenosyl-L-methionine-dependent methyltransferase [Aspergillus undulatus]|uniref:S-adenosyl-L-methionine-dependent methyltransferase n=1 Tax=Aspergillus undulatus TaxID=1810928 RepID=UPI003CCD8B17
MAGPFNKNSMDIEGLIEGISHLADDLGGGRVITLNQEKQLRAACQRLSSRLRETTLEIPFPEKTAIKIAIDMGIFDFVCGSDKDEFSASEIAAHTGTELVLVERIMRPLVLCRLFGPTSHNTYRAHRSVNDLAPGAYLRDMINFTHEVADLALLKLPEFLANNRHRNPDRSDASAFQYAHQTSEPFYTWLQKHPDLYSAFCGMMKNTEDFAARWPDLFPVSERFEPFRGPNAERQLRVVDIAGGKGHNIQLLLDYVPDLQAELTLQDLPEVLGDRPAHVDASIRQMPHNFFDPQPIRGADIYALTRVLHNWPDKECQKILGHIAAAMTPESILLIGDKVFPAGAAELTPGDIMADMSMMMLFGGMERTESQFRELLLSTGLELVTIWRSKGPSKNNEGLLEVRLAGDRGFDIA